MAARIEHGVEVLLLHAVQPDGIRKARLRLLVTMESLRQLGLEGRLVAFGIEWRLAALWGREHHLGTCLEEGVVRGGELLEPKAGFTAGVAELIMRCQDYEDFHYLLLRTSRDFVSARRSWLDRLTNAGPTPTEFGAVQARWAKARASA